MNRNAIQGMQSGLGSRARIYGVCAVVAMAGWASSLAWAHGTKDHGQAKPGVATLAEQMPWGIAGQGAQVVRTIEIKMSDTMRFTPDVIEVKHGETLRLIATNAGGVMHEIVLGTRETLEEHAEMMKKFPNMAHDEPYMAHVSAGSKGEVIWQFNRSGLFEFACLLPGHFEAGMRGRIIVK